MAITFFFKINRCMNNTDSEKKINKGQHCVYYLSEITTSTSNLKNTVLILIDLRSNLPKHPQYSVVVLVEWHLVCTTLDLQLSLYCPLCYNSIDHCPLLQCLHTTSAILAGANSYFVVSLFKCEGKNSCHDLISKPCIILQNSVWDAFLKLK